MKIYLDEGDEKTKSNKANLYFTAENAEFAEQRGICVNDCPIKKYNLYLYISAVFAISAVNENKAKFKIPCKWAGIREGCREIIFTS